VDVARSQDHLLRRLLEGAPLAVYVYDEDDRFTYVNARFGEIFEQPPAGFIGRHPEEVFDAEIAADLVANNARVRQGGRQLFHEQVPHGPDGELHTYATEKFGLSDGQVAGVSIDVTTEHQSTRALRRSDVILEAIAASAADMISVHELETGELRWISEGVRELLGYEPDVLVGTMPRDWIAYDNPQAMVRRHAEGGRAGRAERSVQQITRRDGTTTWVEVHTQPVAVTTEEGEVHVSVAITRDVGERHEREQDLREEVETHQADVDLYEHVLRSVTDPIIIEDLRTGSTVFTNSTMAEAMSSDAEDGAWHEGDLAKHVREELGGDEAARIDATFRHEDGRSFPVEVLVQRLVHRDRDLAIGIARDTSAQKAAQARAEDALEREQEALERLQAVDELRTRMVTSISHEVRTPLTIIHGIAHTLQRGPELDPQITATLLERLAANTTRLDGLLGGLLDLSSASEDATRFVLEEADLGDAVRDVVERVGLPDDCVRLDLAQVRAAVDVAKFRAIVTNLLDNVRRHTPPGTEVRLELACEGDEVVLAVSDNGPGIPAELHSRVFEPFERFTDAAQDHSPGVGLGLPLVQLYARLHGGRCELAPADGAGTSFRVVLPVDGGRSP